MYCKSNIRRVINYTQKEPINKYDLWLSENARYNDEGELEYDNNGLPKCDLILKLYRHGKWEPIVGFNTTALNKINTVKDVEYSFQHNGTAYTKTGFNQFDLPLFRHSDDSPAELFSFGTLGQSINEFVTANEWEDIFNNPNFYNSFISYIRIPAATASRLGGIWVDTFSSSYTGDDYLAQCKYKYNHGTSDYNVFVHAKDILKILNEYIDDSSDDDITYQNLLFRAFKNSSSVIKGWNELPDDATQLLILANKPCFFIGGDPRVIVPNRGKFIKAKDADDDWYNLYGGVDYSLENHCFEYVDIHDYIGGEDPNPSLWRVPIKGVYGINASYGPIGEDIEGYALELSHYPTGVNWLGQYCRTKRYSLVTPIIPGITRAEWLYDVELDNSEHGLEWVTGPQLIKEETNYSQSTMLGSKVYLNCDHGILGWSAIQDGTDDTYTAGYGIDFIEDIQNLNNYRIDLNISHNLIDSENENVEITWDGEGENYLTVSYGGSNHIAYIYTYFEVDVPKSLLIDLSHYNTGKAETEYFFNSNPIYILVNTSSSADSCNIVSGNKIISAGVTITNGYFGKPNTSYLITILFGCIKIEEMETLTY